MSNVWDLPALGVGIGLRGVHVPGLLRGGVELGFLELLTENHIDVPGDVATLERLSARYPMVLHGVSMSIGSADPLDRSYLEKVKALATRVGARWVSDHVCFTGVSCVNTHELLPIPYTEESLRYVAERARVVADVLERPIFFENPSSYMTFACSTMPEEEFLVRLCERAGCGLLLDVNNVYVSARNHGFDPEAYVDAIPAERVVQVHVAGHHDKGTHLLDTHGSAVSDPVWDLYARFVARAGPVSTLLEWDSEIPCLEAVVAEARKALRLIPGGLADAHAA